MVLKTLPKTDYSFLSTQVFAKHSMSLIARERARECQCQANNIQNVLRNTLYRVAVPVSVSVPFPVPTQRQSKLALSWQRLKVQILNEKGRQAEQAEPPPLQDVDGTWQTTFHFIKIPTRLQSRSHRIS